MPNGRRFLAEKPVFDGGGTCPSSSSGPAELRLNMLQADRPIRRPLLAGVAIVCLAREGLALAGLEAAEGWAAAAVLERLGRSGELERGGSC